MNSPELSLDMNLDSPDVADGSLGSGGDYGGGEHNTSTVGIIHHTHTNQREGYHHGDNSSYNGRYTSFSGGSGSIDSNSSNAHHNSKGGGAIKIDGNKMTRLIEEWKDELSMMRVKNAILLDDLVKVGANV